MSAPAFALLAGLAYILASSLGMIFGLIPASLLHHAAHFALGLWGLAAWTGAASALTYARWLAGLGAAFAILGLAGLDTALGLLPMNERDLWGHILSGAFGAYFGYRTAVLPEPHAERRHLRAADRRRTPRPVTFDRRRGDSDRRFGSEAFG